MPVLMPDGTYSRITPTQTLDERRTPKRDYTPTVANTVRCPGYSFQRADRTWYVSLDEAAWPVAYLDLVVRPDGTELIVETANLSGEATSEDALGDVIHVTVTARNRHQAQVN